MLYSLGAYSAGPTCFIDGGVLRYEYNLFIIQRTKIATSSQLPVGDTTIELLTTFAVPVTRPAGLPRLP